MWCTIQHRAQPRKIPGVMDVFFFFFFFNLNRNIRNSTYQGSCMIDQGGKYHRHRTVPWPTLHAESLTKSKVAFQNTYPRLFPIHPGFPMWHAKSPELLRNIYSRDVFQQLHCSFLQFQQALTYALPTSKFAFWKWVFSSAGGTDLIYVTVFIYIIQSKIPLALGNTHFRLQI